MIALKYLKARHIEIATYKVNKRSIQAAVWRDQMQYIEIFEEKGQFTLFWRNSHTSVPNIFMWCGKKAISLHAEFALQMYICYISTNLGSVECLWSNVTDGCGKKLGDGTWASWWAWAWWHALIMVGRSEPLGDRHIKRGRSPTRAKSTSRKQT